jgi:hypothetical protein
MVSSNLAMSDRRVSRQSAFGTVDLLGPIPLLLTVQAGAATVYVPRNRTNAHAVNH